MPARKPTHLRTPARNAARPSPARLAGRTAGRLAWSLARALAAHPALYGGVTVFVAVAALVSGNALFHQPPGGHPKPMLATRIDDAPAAGTAPMATASVVAPPLTNDPSIVPAELVREVQTMLAASGHYTAAIDGRLGHATDAAIRAFQADRGLTVDGVASPLLLAQMRAAEVPEPEPAPERYASIDERAGGDEAGAVASDAASPGGSELVRRIQSGLSAAAVASLKADGILGERTRAAIRTFQALEGLEVTGDPSEQLLARLTAVDPDR